MAKKLPDQIRGMVSMGREAEESMDEGMHVSILVDTTCPEWLVCTVRDALVPERDAIVDVHVLDGRPSTNGIDVGIVLAGHSEALVRGAIRSFAGARQHVLILAESSLDIPQAHMPSKLGQYVVDVVASEPEPLLERFAAALLDATDKDVSCAANFAFCRSAATARLVSRCAARNAVMGVADFIPGAGMPLMTMNQLNLGFDIAATHGRGLSIGRVPEVAFIIAAGLVYRSMARVLIRAIPTLSLVTRVGFAYAGTLVTGRMLSTHFMDEFPPVPGYEDDEA